jgi:L-threonylcarbamoyladenylate synthase
MSPAPHIDDGATRAEVLAVLRRGGVAVLPTDTLYGLSAAATSASGIGHIRAIKRSADERLFIVLASSVDMVAAHVRSFGCSSREELERVWPAPVTAILPVGAQAAEWMGETIAVRVPAVPALLEVIAALGEPIVSTSVNRSGESPRTSLGEIESEFGPEVDMVVRGNVTSTLASTIVDLTGDSPVVVRQGDYTWPSTP